MNDWRTSMYPHTHHGNRTTEGVKTVATHDDAPLSMISSNALFDQKIFVAYYFSITFAYNGWQQLADNRDKTCEVPWTPWWSDWTQCWGLQGQLALKSTIHYIMLWLFHRLMGHLVGHQWPIHYCHLNNPILYIIYLIVPKPFPFMVKMPFDEGFQLSLGKRANDIIWLW